MKIIDVPRSGSYADKTSSHNRAGQYVRNRRSPVQPVGSGRRAIIRGAFGACSAAWSALTDPQRAAWVGYADGIPYTDALGQQIKLTGHQMFVAINTQRLNCGSVIANVPPTTQDTPVLTDVALSGAAGVAALDLSLVTTGAVTDFILVQVSPQMSPGRSFNGRWVQVAVLGGNETDANLLAAFVAEFGALVAGRKVFARVTPVNADGVTGASTVVSAIVAN